MTSYEKYEYWVYLSDYDIQTAADLIKCKRWAYVAFLCQQSVERLVKGMFVCHTGKDAPKSHNLPYLINTLSQHPKLADTEVGKRLKEEKDNYEDFIIDLMFYYMSDYPFSYKRVMERFIDENKAMNLYEKTLETLSWLKKFQKAPVNA
ncbi:MAG: HEPN domain-containing protein [Bacillota bacterium]|nr:HEPN domain-containing protein [Bacillota bacterium]